MKKFLKIVFVIFAVLIVSWLVYFALKFPIAMYGWRQADIHNYEIKISYESPWHSQPYIVVVKNGQFVQSDSYCSKAAIGNEYDQCVFQPFDPDEYTVEGLFEQAKQTSGATIEFAATFHFPRDIYDSGPMGAHDAW